VTGRPEDHNGEVDDDAIAYYTSFLDRHGDLDEAMCWTVVESCYGPATVEDVAVRLGSDPASIRDMPWEASYDQELDGAPVIHLLQAGRAVMMVEVNGFQGSTEAMLTRLSENGRAHSAYWNVNALSALSCAALGYLLVTFEGLFPDDRTGVDACALDDELGLLHESLQAQELDTWAVMMAIVERRTGLRLEDRWFATSQPAVVLSDAVRAAPDRSGRAYCYADPELESALLLAPEAADDAFVRELADVLVAAGELAAEPEIEAALTALGEGVPRGDAGYAPLEQLTGRLRDEAEDTPVADAGRARRRLQAAWSLQLALRPPSHTPRPLHSVQHARLALGDDWLTARRRLRSALR
jgi:hypothetical protein